MQSRHRPNRWSIVTAMMAILAVAATAPAIAQTHGELRGGYYTDVEEGFLGGGVLVPMGQLWYFNPNVEWVFVDGFDYWTANADFHRDLNTGTGPAVWLGAGPALVVKSPEGPGDSDADLGLNLFMGLGVKDGPVRPFTQFKVRISDDTEPSLSLGLRF